MNFKFILNNYDKASAKIAKKGCKLLFYYPNSWLDDNVIFGAGKGALMYK